MAIKYNVTRQGYASPARVLAQNYGAHIFSTVASEDQPNGTLVLKGDYVSLDLYEQADASEATFKATITDKAVNGNFYVEIDENPGHVLVVYQKPLIDEESPRSFTSLYNFYNEKGDDVRSYDTIYGDVWELSAELFDGTPVVGAKISGVSEDGKWVIAASSATTYDITIETATNGTVTADVESAAAGATVTLTATPDSGYELDTLTVTDGDNNEVTVTNNKFTMPASNVTVTATFKQ